MKINSLESVQPKWCRALTFQQQSVLFLAARGPDGVEKFHPCKNIQRAYRATVLMPAKHKKMEFGDRGDYFMSLERFADEESWNADIGDFVNHIDSLPLHYVMHIMHASQVLSFKHPNGMFRCRWRNFYVALTKNFHLNFETEEQMDERLCD